MKTAYIHGCVYTGQLPLQQAFIEENGKFIKISGASLKESHPHDISITKEAPNYSVTQ